MKVSWMDRARRHLRAIHDYIAADSPRNVMRIARKSELLARSPALSHVVPEYDSESVRQILEGIYRIIHRVRPDRVDVLAIIHGDRKLPTLDSLT